MDRGSSVGIATELRAGRSVDRVSVGIRDFSQRSGPALEPTHPPVPGLLSGGKAAGGVALTSHPLPAPKLKNE